MKNIALIAGGDSGEYVVSVNSAKIIRENLDKKKFKAYTIVISQKKWVYLDADNREHPVDKNDFSIEEHGGKIYFDCALITIHGTPGEDGKLQGYFDLLQIPYTTSGLMASSITFNKHFCNALATHWGVDVARSVKFVKGDHLSEAEVLSKVNLPVFIKPNKGGSSLGTTFVKKKEEIMPAVRACLEHDDEVFVEEFLDGVELTCGAYIRNGELLVLPVTEIISKTEARFFDYKAKYTKGAADEITPARISEELKQLVQRTTRYLYQKFELKGICRLDFIYSKDRLFFLEANITPGMAETSIVPQQAEHIGISITQLFTDVLEETLREAR